MTRVVAQNCAAMCVIFLRRNKEQNTFRQPENVKIGSTQILLG
ncbi:MAG: hypothetical protein ACFNXU_01375 [Kingella sp. (in: b-proteobacteria)]